MENQSNTNSQPIGQTPVFKLMSDIFMSPSRAMDNLKQSYPVLFPLSLVVLVNVVLVILLFANIDYQWYVDFMVEAQAGDLSQSEQDQIRQGMEMVGPIITSVLGVVGVVIMTAIIYALYAAYLVMISSVTNDGFEFKQWLSLVSWAHLPSLISALAGFVVVLTTTNGQISPMSVNPLTLNELFFSLNATHGLGAILATIDITTFWSLALMSVGYSRWTEKSIFASTLIVSAPFVIYVVVRIAIALS